MTKTMEVNAQVEAIKGAKRAYLTVLNDPKDGMSALRFAVYLDGLGGLQVLWPADSHKGSKAGLLPHQVYSKNRKYPAFHFSLKGCGYSKAYEIKTTLTEINPEIRVYTLTGGSPSEV